MVPETTKERLVMFDDDRKCAIHLYIDRIHVIRGFQPMELTINYFRSQTHAGNLWLGSIGLPEPYEKILYMIDVMTCVSGNRPAWTLANRS